MHIFATTHWSLVLAAGRNGDAEAAAALGDLCRIYWYPLYSYIRSRGYGPSDAEDLTQGFFLHLLKDQAVARADQRKGRFRSFLLGALNHYLADVHDRAKAKKRGGDSLTFSIDAAEAEERYRLEPTDRWSPDRLFERQWALALLDEVSRRLQLTEVQAGRGAAFERLRQYALFTGGDEPYAQVARDLGMTEEAVKKAVQRLRRRYQQLFREEIQHTVGTASEVDAEIGHLCELMAQ
ncbi:MAG: RNA polymerase sigma factor [Verrucomicrobiia bacterium]